MPGAIEILVDEKFHGEIDRGWVRKIVRQVLKAEQIKPPYEVSLVFTESETVRGLNRAYRALDETTDVLAFYMLSHKGNASPFALPPDGITRLGEVVISYPQAVAQAKEKGHSPERELALLILHGILHLLDYDHEEPREAEKMRERETGLLEKCAPRQ